MPRRLLLILTLCGCVAPSLGCWGDDDDGGGGDGQGACWALEMVQRRAGTRIRGPIDGVYFLSAYTFDDAGGITPPDGSPCTADIARRLSEACGRCREDGAACEPLVRAIFATPSAACTTCGDGFCLTGEDASTCAQDCADNCGDGLCASVENAIDCPSDCAVACGDGLCTAGESPTACPIDCQYTVGDGLCQAGENPISSPADCAAWTCGDGYCQSYEGAERCPSDCCESALRCAPGTFCMSWNKVGRCRERGEGGCTQRTEEEVCAFGCVQSDELFFDAGTCTQGCGSARCKTCTESILELGLGEPCVIGQYPARCEASPRSSAQAHVSCVPMPGFGECGVLRRVACVSPADSGGSVYSVCDGERGCMLCDPSASCTQDSGLVGAQRCAGQVAEECIQVAGCTLWQPLAVCADTQRCEQPLGGAAACVDL
jgi:hypothetical protein